MCVFACVWPCVRVHCQSSVCVLMHGINLHGATACVYQAGKGEPYKGYI